MKEMTVDAIMYDLVAKAPVVLLKEENGDRFLPILIGTCEANAINLGLKNTPLQRPLTHDLLNHVLDKLQCTVEYILITRIEDSTFFADIVIYNDGEKMEIDARPSDAIALAIRTKSPILVHEDILVKAGIPMKAIRRETKAEHDEIGDEGNFNLDIPKRTDEMSQFRDF
ncbi:MAG: bifunctional nuclease family protein, partial [bacterium]